MLWREPASLFVCLPSSGLGRVPADEVTWLVLLQVLAVLTQSVGTYITQMLSPSSNGSWVVGQEEELEMGRKVPVEQSLLAGRTHHSCLLFPLFQFFTH